jgi:hypothetical protein
MATTVRVRAIDEDHRAMARTLTRQRKRLMVAAADRSAGGWWRDCSALSLRRCESRKFHPSVSHKSDSLIMCLMIFRTNIHDLL